MTFTLVLLGSIVAVMLLRNPLKKWPLLFYALAIAADVLFVATLYLPLPREVWGVLNLLIHKCTLSLALFVIVMFIGVFAQDSKVKTWLRPVRAELSIIAWILSMGHMDVYLVAYAPRVFAGSFIDLNVMASFVLAIVLLALLLVLGVTSFNVVKKRMKTDTWKRVQWWAYPFFGLVYAHLVLMLLPPALRGGEAAQISVAVYTVIFGAYAALRIYRALADKRHASVVMEGSASAS